MRYTLPSSQFILKVRRELPVGFGRLGPARSTKLMWKQLLTITILITCLAVAMAQTPSPMKSSTNPPTGYWPLEKSQPIIDKTQTIRLAPDLSQLTAGERSAVAKLLEVGKIFQASL